MTTKPEPTPIRCPCLPQHPGEMKIWGRCNVCTGTSMLHASEEAMRLFDFAGRVERCIPCQGTGYLQEES